MNYTAARENMIEQQIRPWDVLNQNVLNVLNALPRENYAPESHKSLAYADTRLPLSEGRKMLNPNIEGRILQNLGLSESDRVLEIGTGSGYLTACIATMCRHIDSIEANLELAELAETRLKEQGLSNYSIEVGGFEDATGKGEQYDAILINGSTATAPQSSKEKLAIGGRLFCFVGSVDEPVHHAVILTRISETEWSEEMQFETWVDPLY